MYTRRKFITNSSSTAFIAYGITLSGYPTDDSEEQLRDENGNRIYWEDYYEELSGIPYGDIKVEFWIAAESDAAVMVVSKSRQDIEYGCVELKLGVKENWDKTIKDACRVLGVENQKPTWLGWYTGYEG